MQGSELPWVRKLLPTPLWLLVIHPTVLTVSMGTDLPMGVPLLVMGTEETQDASLLTTKRTEEIHEDA